MTVYHKGAYQVLAARCPHLRCGFAGFESSLKVDVLGLYALWSFFFFFLRIMFFFYNLGSCCCFPIDFIYSEKLHLCLIYSAHCIFSPFVALIGAAVRRPAYAIASVTSVWIATLELSLSNDGWIFYFLFFSFLRKTWNTDVHFSQVKQIPYNRFIISSLWSFISSIALLSFFPFLGQDAEHSHNLQPSRVNILASFSPAPPSMTRIARPFCLSVSSRCFAFGNFIREFCRISAPAFSNGWLISRVSGAAAAATRCSWWRDTCAEVGGIFF